MKNSLEYGPVYIAKGKYKGSIGVYDDDEGRKAIVYLADMSSYVLIDPKNIQNIRATADLRDYVTGYILKYSLFKGFFKEKTTGDQI